MASAGDLSAPLDRELDDFPAEHRQRVWMNRLEAVIFASPRPVPREVLQTVIGEGASFDELMGNIIWELRARPYDIVEVAGGFQMRTKPELAPAIRHSGVLGPEKPDLTQRDLTILMAIAYFQPVTRARLSTVLGRNVSRDVISALSRRKLIGPGPRSPLPGAPYTYVTTPTFLVDFGFKSLSELPDLDKLHESGLLSNDRIDVEQEVDASFEMAEAEED
jgi:segregation and condensation protein B